MARSKFSASNALGYVGFLGCVLFTWTGGLMFLVGACKNALSAEQVQPFRLLRETRRDAYSSEAVELAKEILLTAKLPSLHSSKAEVSQLMEALALSVLRASKGEGEGRAPAPAGAAPPAADRATRAHGGREETEVYTQQTCYIASDESEMCVFHGPLCFDGQGPVVFVPHPIRDSKTGGPAWVDDYTSTCVDPRYYEPTGLEDGGCSIITAGERRSYDATRPIDPATGFSMGLLYRRWGPTGRNGGLFFREELPSEVFGEHPARTLSAAAAARFAAVSPDLTVQESAPTRHESIDGLVFAGRTVSPAGIQVDWLDSPLWLAGIDGQWDENPFHWWTKIGALYDARRSNATPAFGDHPDDGYMQWVEREAIPGVMSIFSTWRREASVEKQAFSRANAIKYRVGAQWGPLPPLKSVFFTGDGAKAIPTVDKLGSWFRETLLLATPPGTVHTFNDLLSTLGPNKMVCSATGGVIPGNKAKWFTGRGDAWMWRQYAYQATGLSAQGVKPHPKYPPRKITFVDRKGMNGRGVYNRDAVIAAIAATGVPYQLVHNMGSMTFAEQVELMSGTGTLIAPHGAALANAMFLPAHSVVVEMFPYGMKKNTYRHLASMADLTYFPLHSWDLLPLTDENANAFYGVQLMREEYYWSKCAAMNISSMDALNEHACNAASKNYPILVDIGSLQGVLRDAVDATGAYSLANPAWKEEAQRLGIKPRQAPAYVQESVHGMGGKK